MYPLYFENHEKATQTFPMQDEKSREQQVIELLFRKKLGSKNPETLETAINRIRTKLNDLANEIPEFSAGLAILRSFSLDLLEQLSQIRQDALDEAAVQHCKFQDPSGTPSRRPRKVPRLATVAQGVVSRGKCDLDFYDRPHDKTKADRMIESLEELKEWRPSSPPETSHIGPYRVSELVRMVEACGLCQNGDRDVPAALGLCTMLLTPTNEFSCVLAEAFLSMQQDRIPGLVLHPERKAQQKHARTTYFLKWCGYARTGIHDVQETPDWWPNQVKSVFGLKPGPVVGTPSNQVDAEKQAYLRTLDEMPEFAQLRELVVAME